MKNSEINSNILVTPFNLGVFTYESGKYASKVLKTANLNKGLNQKDGNRQENLIVSADLEA